MKKMILISLYTIFLCQAADPMVVDEGRSTQADIYLVSENQLCAIPRNLAAKYFEIVNLQLEHNPAIQKIELGMIAPENLQILVNLIKKADQILVEKPTQAQGSYVQLSNSRLLELSTARLLEILNSSYIYKLDERILKAIALKIARLTLKSVQPLFENPTDRVRKDITDMADNLELTGYVSTIFPYIASQYLLLTGKSLYPKNSRDPQDNLSVRDLFVHNRIPKIRTEIDEMGQSYQSLSFDRMHLNDLDGLNDVPNIRDAHTLYLSQNRLTTFNLQQEAFNTLVNLRELDLSNNQITDLQPDAFNNRLRKLYLTGNQIVLQPGIFSTLGNLEDLSLRNNQLTSLQPGEFNGLAHLIELDLADNEFTSLQPNTFNGLPELLVLDLSGNKLKDWQPGAFNGLRNLSSLQLHNNFFTNLRPGDFNGLPNLTELDLANNKLERLLPNTFDGFRSLQHLLLSHNQLALLETGAFNHLNTLERLELNENKLTTLPPNIFNRLPAIRTLNLRSNPFSEETKEWIKEHYPFATI